MGLGVVLQQRIELHGVRLVPGVGLAQIIELRLNGFQRLRRSGQRVLGAERLRDQRTPESRSWHSLAMIIRRHVRCGVFGGLSHCCSARDVHRVLQDRLVDEVGEGVGVLLGATRLRSRALCMFTMRSGARAEGALEGGVHVD